MNILENRVAIVTGGSRGIGKAIAAAFAREGARVVISSRKPEGLSAAAKELNGRGHSGKVTAQPCHVGKLEELQHLVSSTESALGPIDVLVNNAATNIAQGPALTFDDTQFDKMIEVNLKSAYRLIRLVAPGMCDRGRGSIINIASIAGLRPQVHGLLYSITKAALIMMTQSYAVELGARGVRVNAIAPGLIKTVLSEYYWKDQSRSAAMMEHQPIKHLGEPEEIAETAVLLASDGASYLTGQTIVVDGGRVLSSM